MIGAVCSQLFESITDCVPAAVRLTRLRYKEGGVAQVRELLPVERAVLAGGVHKDKQHLAPVVVHHWPRPGP